MIDIERIRENPDWVREQIRKLNDEAALPRIDVILDLDEKRRSLRGEVEAMQAQRNNLNKKMGKLRGDKSISDDVKVFRLTLAAKRINEALSHQTADNFDFVENLLKTAWQILVGAKDKNIESQTMSLADAMQSFIEEIKEINEIVDNGFNQIKEIEAELDENMLWIPNLPHESVPVSAGEEGNVAWEPEGEFYEFDFDPKPHWDLGPELGIIDFDRGVKLSGSRFYILQGWGARLQRALISFFLDKAREKGFTELYLPYLVQEEMLVGASQFPKFRDVVYEDPEANLYLLPTAEVAITNIHRDEIIEEAQLPLYYVGHTPCFRKEKSSAGRDTRGIKRVHQFEKVEMYKFVSPETSYDELETLTEAAADVVRALKLPFRRLEISTGDLGFSATKKYDLEIWSPGCEEWLEVSSCSNVEAFQARRAMIRYRPDGGGKSQYVHTLNGSGLATPRVMIAIMENYQQEDGSVIIPEVLRPYLGGAEKITKD